MYQSPLLNKYLDNGLITTGSPLVFVPKPVENFIRIIFTGSTTGVTAKRTHEDLFHILYESDLRAHVKTFPVPDLTISSNHNPVEILADILTLNNLELFSYYSEALDGDQVFQWRSILISDIFPTHDRIAAVLVAHIKYMDARLNEDFIVKPPGSAYTQAAFYLAATPDDRRKIDEIVKDYV